MSQIFNYRSQLSVFIPLLIFLVGLICISILTTVITASSYQRFERQEQRHALLLAASIGAMIERAVRNNRKDDIPLALELALSDRTLLTAIMINEAGLVVYTSNHSLTEGRLNLSRYGLDVDQLGALPPIKTGTRLFNDGTLLITLTAVFLFQDAGSLLPRAQGGLILLHDLSKYQDTLSAESKRLAFYTSFGLLVLCVAIYFILNKYLIRRIGVIQRNLNYLSTHRYDKLIPDYGRDEIADISRSLGDVARELSGFYTKLVVSEEKYRDLFNYAPVIIIILTRNGIIDSINQYGAHVLGYLPENLIGMPITSLSPPEVNYAGHLADLNGGQTVNEQTFEVRRIHSTGKILWCRDILRLVKEEGADQYYLAVSENITEAFELSKELEYQSNHDVLTGLYNRYAFEKQLGRLLADARNNETHHALCYLDLDQFKVVNDTCGHSAGDELLKELAGLFLSQSEHVCYVARLGGDEFGFLIEDANLMMAELFANRLCSLIERHRFKYLDKVFTVSGSIGLVEINTKFSGVSQITMAADSACYAAKDLGRNAVYCFQHNDAQLSIRRQEMSMVSQVTNALDNDGFILYIQEIGPLGDGDEKECIDKHYEVLIRMVNDNGEIILPGVFLPVVERYGLSARLDSWVIERVLYTKSRDNNPYHQATLSINLSGSTVSDVGFTDNIMRLIRRYRVDPRLICFEITETSVISNLSNAQLMMKRLVDIGCRFSLDDFGSGFSSFSYLKNLDVYYIKIDGVFVKDMLEDPVNHVMVKSIQEIARVMGKITVAEYVETEEIIDALKLIGVDFAQGYAIGKPMQMDYNAKGCRSSRAS